MSTSSIKRRIGRFHVEVVQWTSKKCTKKRDARAELLFWPLNRLFFWSRRCGRRRSCLSSLIIELWRHYTTCSPSFFRKGQHVVQMKAKSACTNEISSVVVTLKKGSWWWVLTIISSWNFYKYRHYITAGMIRGTQRGYSSKPLNIARWRYFSS